MLSPHMAPPLLPSCSTRLLSTGTSVTASSPRHTPLAPPLPASIAYYVTPDGIPLHDMSPCDPMQTHTAAAHSVLSPNLGHPPYSTTGRIQSPNSCSLPRFACSADCPSCCHAPDP